MSQRLHPTQARLLELLKDNITEPLTVRQLRELLDVSSISLVQHHIRQLESKGYLRRNKMNPRDYQILGDEPEKKITYLNLYGLAQCGPGGSLLDGAPIDRIPISTQLLGFPSAEGFLVKAKGSSMVPMIKDADLVIARTAPTAESGNIVVCVNDGEALIKKLVRSGDDFWLTSLNHTVEPFPIGSEFRVEGIVKGVISYIP